MQGQYFCANCMFNYTKLMDNRSKLDRVLIDTLAEGGFGPLYASALYQRVTLTSPAESTQYIRQLAQKNNIDLNQGHWFAKVFDFLFKLLKVGKN